MQERSLIGLEARAADGSEVGRIADVVEDEESGEVTHVVVETESGEWLEVPITDLSLDPDADFATFEADASDEEPGDHTGDEAEPGDYYAPDDINDEDEEDFEHEGQLVTEPEDGHDPSSEEDLEAREDWEDHSYTSDSGYPRNDVYIDPDTGDEEIDPLLEENNDVKDDVEDLLEGTSLEVRSVREGVVELTGTAATQDDLEEAVREIMGLDEVLEVDITDVDVG
ncbi:MAG TPA: PRC-barrel domain-containing protein [Rubrobacter sp.]|nr:PRC-barrel domain-containing protein [Rubrobacter sp.]